MSWLLPCYWIVLAIVVVAVYCKQRKERDE